jgi:molybdopterin/thiamine biosynthesis adenylyltransferase
MGPEPSRYSRQILFKPIGEKGQRRLAESRVAVIGCGALGSVSASLLARAGVGFLRIVDRDIVEMDNLQRQFLFDESDVHARLPKAAAARRKLQLANSEVTVEAEVADVTFGNVERLIGDVDLVLDGTDNFETRFVINDACLKLRRPWIYAGCVGSHGMLLAIVPGRTACFRCFVHGVPDPAHTQTCDTAGIVAAASATVASLQAAAALRLLTEGETDGRLVTVDVWPVRIEPFEVAPSKGCPACGGSYEFLRAEEGSFAVTLCGRNAVQVSPPAGRVADLSAFERKLPGSRRNDYLLRFNAEGHEITLFSDGRALIHGTTDSARARTLYARYIGS